MFTATQKFEISLKCLFRDIDSFHYLPLTPYDATSVRQMTAQADVLFPTRRVLYLAVPASCKARRLLAILADALDLSPLQHGESGQEAQGRIARAYRNTVGLLVIGQAHHLDTHGLHMLRRDNGMCPVILAGDDRLLRTLDRDEYLLSRTQYLYWRPNGLE